MPSRDGASTAPACARNSSSSFGVNGCHSAKWPITRPNPRVDTPGGPPPPCRLAIQPTVGAIRSSVRRQ